jgi:hypothetical protein
MGRWESPQAHGLRNAMADATLTLGEAQERYQRAIAIAEDTERGADGMLALQHAGRAYAEAVTKYSKAAMAWLSYVDIYTMSLKASNTPKDRT